MATKSAQKQKETGAAPGKWTHQVGLKPHTVTVYERSDKGLTLWLRWTSRHPAKSGLAKMSLGFRLRDERGRIDREKFEKAEQAAKRAYNRLLKDEDPRTPEASTTADGAPKLTIAAGLERALLVPGGMYAKKSDYVSDMSRYKVQLLAHLPSNVITWDQISSATYEQVWRSIALTRTKSGKRTGPGAIAGKRSAELAIVLLAQAGRWLKRAKLVTVEVDAPDERWKEKFAADWADITKDPAIAPDQPRHSVEELGLLWQALDAGLGDPRIRLGLATAGEARLGQALQCDRRLLDLSAVGSHRLGRFTIAGNRKKKGVVIDLVPALRAMWDDALTTGYLRDLEAAYQAGIVRTYPLFPGKRLVKGRARVDVQQPIGKRGALDLFHDLERIAGIEVQEGRGWYGVRRISTDLAEDVETDGRVLNAITGHTSDDTRRKVYQQKQRDAVLAKAANARTAARDAAVAAAQAAGVALRPSSPTPSEEEASGLKRRASRKTPAYIARPCPGCGNLFMPTGANAKRCATCSPRRPTRRKCRDLPRDLPPGEKSRGKTTK